MINIIKNKNNTQFYAVLAVAVCFFYLVRNILPPFIISTIIAFLFKNLVKKLEKKELVEIYHRYFLLY